MLVLYRLDALLSEPAKHSRDLLVVLNDDDDNNIDDDAAAVTTATADDVHISCH